MNICVLADSYPSKNSFGGIFVAKLFDEIADLGNNVVIIAPQSITNSLLNKKSLSPKKYLHVTKNKAKVTVYQPYTITFSNYRVLRKLNSFFKRRAVSKVIKKLKVTPDAYYGHFWHNAYILFRAISHSDAPLFVATGESVINFHMQISDIQKKSLKKYVRGVICVSTKNKDESIAKGLATENKCIVIPNAFDNTEFYIKDKLKCRRQLGFPLDSFIIAFTGAFKESKGVYRLSQAIQQLNDPSINSIFIGAGSLKPQCEGILFEGLLPHNKIADYLNCADVFVFPTLAEGASNAIVEAIGCGLPVISSDLPFNYDMLNESNSILVDPLNIDEIANAIKDIKTNNALRKRLAEGAEETSQYFILSNRAKKMCKYINNKI